MKRASKFNFIYSYTTVSYITEFGQWPLHNSFLFALMAIINIFWKFSGQERPELKYDYALPESNW